MVAVIPVLWMYVVNVVVVVDVQSLFALDEYHCQHLLVPKEQLWNVIKWLRMTFFHSGPRLLYMIKRISSRDGRCSGVQLATC